MSSRMILTSLDPLISDTGKYKIENENYNTPLSLGGSNNLLAWYKR